MSCVYIHINNVNGKKYIGYSKHDNPEIRWGNEGKGYQGQKFYNEGIVPFGWNNFDHKILIKDISNSLAQSLEYLLIENFNLTEMGYNEDKGILFEADKELAYSLVTNLINQIKNIDKSNFQSLKSLGDIISSKYMATTVNYRLEYLYNLYQIGRINTKLDCQREYVWDEKRQQGMWDTLLYGHRIPEIHAIRQNNGTYDIIDGKQRLLTLMKILNNEIPLKRTDASEEIRQYMSNNNISSLRFKDLDEKLQNRIYDKELAMAEYTNVDETTLVTLFQKLNAGKPLSDFQKCIANNIIVRIRYTEHFENNSFIVNLFTPAELSKNEDEIMLVRMLSALNCGKIENIDDLSQRELAEIIAKMDNKTLTLTRDKINNIIKEMEELNVSSENLKIINKTWYPVLFKFFNEEIPNDQKQYFKDFIPNINIPPQRGRESSKRESIERFNSIKKDWKAYLANIPLS